jgi:hypothetical protein
VLFKKAYTSEREEEEEEELDNIKSIQIVCKFETTGACMRHQPKQQQQQQQQQQRGATE